jgi:hypothetical protein
VTRSSALRRTLPNDYFRRWFSTAHFDLVVWYKPDDAIYGFQLCYDKDGREKAFTWLEDKGFSHQSIDSGEESPLANRTPILVPLQGRFETARVLACFRASDEKLPIKLRALVRRKIREYGRLHGSPTGKNRG